MTSRIQSCIDHIKTSVDIDPWAAELAEKALRQYEPRVMTLNEDTENLPAVDAIPVEWLKAQIRSYTGDVSDIGKSARNGTIKDLIRKWQKEQEAR